MTFEPVKIPSTVFNNMLVDIMKKLAQKHDLDFMVTRDFYKDVYAIGKMHEGISVGRNPFQSRSAYTETFMTVNALRADRSIRFDDPIAGIDLKQFFMNEQEMVDYFENIEKAMTERIEKVIEAREERKDKE